MATIQDIRIVSTEWPVLYQDAGYDALITSLAPQMLMQAEFLAALNAAGSQPAMTLSMLLRYIAERQAAGRLRTVEVHSGTLPPVPAQRPDAPEGIGQDASTIWFTTPDEGVYDIAVLINGELRKTFDNVDVAANRSVPKAALAPLTAGDVVQISLKDGRVWGWIGRINNE